MPTNPTPGPGVDFVPTLTAPDTGLGTTGIGPALPPHTFRVGVPLEHLAARVDGLAAQLQATEKWCEELRAANDALASRVAELERGQGEPARIGGDS